MTLRVSYLVTAGGGGVRNVRTGRQPLHTQFPHLPAGKGVYAWTEAALIISLFQKLMLLLGSAGRFAREKSETFILLIPGWIVHGFWLHAQLMELHCWALLGDFSLNIYIFLWQNTYNTNWSLKLFLRLQFNGIKLTKKLRGFKSWDVRRCNCLCSACCSQELKVILEWKSPDTGRKLFFWAFWCLRCPEREIPLLLGII